MSSYYQQAKEIAERAVIAAPLDPAPAAVALLNQLPSWNRERACGYLNDRLYHLRNKASVPFDLPEIQLHSAEHNYGLWRHLSDRLPSAGGGESELLTSLASIIDPTLAQHEPLAYLGAWNGGSDWYVISPMESRRRLRLSEDDQREIVGYLKEIAVSKSAVRQFPKATSPEPRAEKPKVVVAVGPYADMLSLPALIYAVSDLIEGVEVVFRPAYVFSIGASEDLWEDILSPELDLGYALAANAPSRPRSVFINIFERAITRSIATRPLSPSGPPELVPHMVHFSMLGDLSVDSQRAFNLQEEYTSADVLANAPKASVMPEINFDLARVSSDPTSTELVLLLALLGMRIDVRRRESLRFAGATVSTDAHSWAVHNGILRSRLTPDLLNNVLKRSLSQIAWRPPPNTSDPSDRDRNANLSWFTPRLRNEAMSEEIAQYWKDLADRIISQRIRSAGFSRTSSSQLSAQDLDRRFEDVRVLGKQLAQPLIAPLLKAFPGYSGAIRYLPEEAWMAKIVSPNGHMDYVPYWQSSWHKRAGQAGGVAQAVRS